MLSILHVRLTPYNFYKINKKICKHIFKRFYKKMQFIVNTIKNQTDQQDTR